MRFKYVAGPVLLFLTLIVSACLVYRERGVYSVPYLDQPPSRKIANGSATKVSSVEIPDLKIYIDLWNDVRTSRRPVVGFEIPLVAGPANRKRVWVYGTDDEGYCLTLTFYPERDGFAFDPMNLVLSVDDRSFSPVRSYRAAASNSYYPVEWEDVSATVRLLTVEEMERRSDEMGISGRQQFCYFKVCYETERPDPEREIRLDLAPALTHPDLGPMPSVRFIRGVFKEWSEY